MSRNNAGGRGVVSHKSQPVAPVKSVKVPAVPGPVDNRSIKEQIRTAKKPGQIKGILDRAASFVYASGHTRRQWDRLAGERTKALTAA